ncbi:hypothetical protein [Nostoc sp.]|uniref:hypothetical protein n=1 Tax=Nostoc sp. TaxID=1180 RepID=UPI002FF6EB25
MTLEQVYATILYIVQRLMRIWQIGWNFQGTMREEQQRNPSPARMRFWRMQQENAPKQLQES